MPAGVKSFILKISAGWALLTTLYCLWGHRIIAHLYHDQSFPLANRFFEGKNQFPLSVYCQTGDAFLAAGLLITFLFLLPAFFILKSNLSEKSQWAAAALLMFTGVVLFYFKPYFGENEAVYLINPRRLAHPGYLSNDWTWKQGAYTHFLFDLLLSPLTLFLDDFAIALTGRLVVWALLIFTLLRMAKTLGLNWWEITLGFFFWLSTRQSIAAGEWLFHSFEAKCLAYFFFFLALDHMLNDRWIKTAIYCGTALSFHFLIGLWGSSAILLTALTAQPVKQTFNNCRIALIAFAITAAPGIMTAVLYRLKSGPADKGDYALNVFMRAPHHLDPSYFLTPPHCLSLITYSLATFWLIRRVYSPGLSQKLTRFLAFLLLPFILGLAAHKFSLPFFLYLYPFRLGPFFLSLFFSITAFKFLHKEFCGHKKHISRKGLAIALLLCLLAIAFKAPDNFIRRTAGFVFDWRNHLAPQIPDDFNAAAQWIKANTPQESIFIAPPWEDRFWILTGRAQVVSFKYLFADHSIHEWYARLQALNGEIPFKNRGSIVLSELKSHYPALTQAQILTIKNRYAAAYYLTTTPRPDLPDPAGCHPDEPVIIPRAGCPCSASAREGQENAGKTGDRQSRVFLPRIFQRTTCR